MYTGGPTVSGLDDHDYPNLNGASMSLTNINQMKIHSKIPLPSEVMEHFGRILPKYLREQYCFRMINSKLF